MSDIKADRILRDRVDADYAFQVSLGQVPGAERVLVSGVNNGVTTAYAVVSPGGIWQGPQPAGATALRVKAGDASNGPAGAGARLILLEGLDAEGNYISDLVATNGTSAGALSSKLFLRLNFATVVQSGSYATPLAGSHSADVVIESAGGVPWMTISATDALPGRGVGQSGVYSVPTGKTAWIVNVATSVQATKAANLLFWTRGNILEAAAPYSPMRVLFDAKGNSSTLEFPQQYPQGPLVGPCDVGVLGKFDVSGGQIGCQLTLIQVAT